MPEGAKPLLAIDVDGVLSLFGFDRPPSDARFELIDGTPHCISIAAAERIVRLGERLELVWATGWQDRANDRLSMLTGIGPLPVVEFDAHRAVGSSAMTTAAHWKLGALEEFARGRALAWIDDSFDRSCYEWAADREGSGLDTLLVPTEPDIGLEEAQAAAILDWASEASPSGGRADHLH